MRWRPTTTRDSPSANAGEHTVAERTPDKNAPDKNAPDENAPDSSVVETTGPTGRLHHAHLMAADIDATIDFWTTCFGAEVVADEQMAGSRNVFLDIGGGRLNLYDQAPNERGPVNHLGIQVDDLPKAVAQLDANGWKPRPIKVDGPLSYAMVEGPDGVLLEVFHFNEETASHLRPYFDLEDDGDDDSGQ